MSGLTVGDLILPESLGIKLLWLYFLSNNSRPFDSV